jgi:hypothetical protein
VRLAVTELTTLVDMRRFIVTNPNLSVGRPGDIVTSDELKMSDDKLDEWVDAGHGIEVVTATAEPSPPVISHSTPPVIEDVWPEDDADLFSLDDDED